MNFIDDRLPGSHVGARMPKSKVRIAPLRCRSRSSRASITAKGDARRPKSNRQRLSGVPLAGSAGPRDERGPAIARQSTFCYTGCVRDKLLTIIGEDHPQIGRADAQEEATEADQETGQK